MKDFFIGVLTIAVVIGVAALIYEFVNGTDRAIKNLFGFTERRLRFVSDDKANTLSQKSVRRYKSVRISAQELLSVALQKAQESGCEVKEDINGYKLAFRSWKGDASLMVHPSETDELVLRLLNVNDVHARLNRGLLSAANYVEELESYLRSIDPALEISREAQEGR